MNPQSILKRIPVLTSLLLALAATSAHATEGGHGAGNGGKGILCHGRDGSEKIVLADYLEFYEFKNGMPELSVYSDGSGSSAQKAILAAGSERAAAELILLPLKQSDFYRHRRYIQEIERFEANASPDPRLAPVDDAGVTFKIPVNCEVIQLAKNSDPGSPKSFQYNPAHWSQLDLLTRVGIKLHEVISRDFARLGAQTAKPTSGFNRWLVTAGRIDGTMYLYQLFRDKEVRPHAFLSVDRETEYATIDEYAESDAQVTFAFTQEEAAKVGNRLWVVDCQNRRVDVDPSGLLDTRRRLNIADDGQILSFASDAVRIGSKVERPPALRLPVCVSGQPIAATSFTYSRELKVYVSVRDDRRKDDLTERSHTYASRLFTVEMKSWERFSYERADDYDSGTKPRALEDHYQVDGDVKFRRLDDPTQFIRVAPEPTRHMSYGYMAWDYEPGFDLDFNSLGCLTDFNLISGARMPLTLSDGRSTEVTGNVKLTRACGLKEGVLVKPIEFDTPMGRVPVFGHVTINDDGTLWEATTARSAPAVVPILGKVTLPSGSKIQIDSAENGAPAKLGKIEPGAGMLMKFGDLGEVQVTGWSKVYIYGTKEIKADETSLKLTIRFPKRTQLVFNGMRYDIWPNQAASFVLANGVVTDFELRN